MWTPNNVIEVIEVESNVHSLKVKALKSNKTPWIRKLITFFFLMQSRNTSLNLHLQKKKKK
jgi:hypothetical protein